MLSGPLFPCGVEGVGESLDGDDVRGGARRSQRYPVSVRRGGSEETGVVKVVPGIISTVWSDGR